MACTLSPFYVNNNSHIYHLYSSVIKYIVFCHQTIYRLSPLQIIATGLDTRGNKTGLIAYLLKEVRNNATSVEFKYRKLEFKN